jgi:tetratricopeptide (TPR) repeat protein
MLACAMGQAGGAAQAQLGPANCGPLANGFGPFDYRSVRGNQLFLVESAHFTPQVEMLMRGKTGAIGQDIDYTLRAFPNHHRALLSMMNLGERQKQRKPHGANYEVECYFIRAVTFQPDDVVARMLFAKFLLGAQRRDEALRQLAQAQAHARDNPFTHYNLGLIYLQAEQYDDALMQAHRAMALGFPRTELKDQLQAQGQWREPTPAAAAATASAASAAASAP